MDVREALLRAAVEVFAEVGTRGATTRRIAQQAGVNEVTLFRQFKSKDDLIRAALQQFAQKITRRELPDDPIAPEAELRAWAFAHHRELYNVRALVRKAMGEFEEHPDNCTHGMQASVHVANDLTFYLDQLRRKGLASGSWDARAAAAMLMGAIFSDAMGRDTTPQRFPYSVRGAIDQYVRLLLDAVGCPGTADAIPTTRRKRSDRAPAGKTASAARSIGTPSGANGVDADAARSTYLRRTSPSKRAGAAAAAVASASRQVKHTAKDKRR